MTSLFCIHVSLFQMVISQSHPGSGLDGNGLPPRYAGGMKDLVTHAPNGRVAIRDHTFDVLLVFYLLLFGMLFLLLRLSSAKRMKNHARFS